MAERKIQVPNISCGHCVATIKREVGELRGVTAVDADAQTKEVTINWTDPANWDQISAKLTEIGYPAG